MSSHWMRRALLALATAAAALMAACGSGSIESQLNPSRIVAFGDGFSDLGQAGARYTVNDGSVNIWLHQVAASFGTTLTSAASGGTSYATGNVRVNTQPSAAGTSTAPTVKEQIDLFLAAKSLSPNDLVVINGGIADVIAETARLNAGTQSRDQTIANVRQAGRDLGGQVRRLVEAGASHVVVVGTYDLAKSPWAIATAQTGLLTEASSKFNEQLLLSIVDLGANVLYVDAALLFNLMVASPGVYGLSNATDIACTSVDAGPGIGIGAGQVNSALCTPSTIVAGANYNAYLFADRVYPAPQAHRKFGEYAYDRIRSRW